MVDGKAVWLDSQPEDQAKSREGRHLHCGPSYSHIVLDDDDDDDDDEYIYIYTISFVF